jgi:hypothetical protein
MPDAAADAKSADQCQVASMKSNTDRPGGDPVVTYWYTDAFLGNSSVDRQRPTSNVNYRQTG